MAYTRTNWKDFPDTSTPINAARLNNIEDGIEQAMDITSKIADLIYPVGSVYMSTANVSPQIFLGGTWNQIKDTFLLAAGDNHTAGAVGGEENHIITTAEMPPHNHSFTGTQATTDNGGVDHTHTGTTSTVGNHSHSYALSKDALTGTSGTQHWVSDWNHSDALTVYSNTSPAGSHNHTFATSGASAYAHGHTFRATGTISDTGSGTAMNNMPPYLTVYMWERVA